MDDALIDDALIDKAHKVKNSLDDLFDCDPMDYEKDDLYKIIRKTKIDMKLQQDAAEKGVNLYGKKREKPKQEFKVKTKDLIALLGKK